MYVHGSIQQGIEGVYFEADVVHTMNLKNICDHLAYAFVEGETEDAWAWFLRLLRLHVAKE